MGGLATFERFPVREINTFITIGCKTVLCDQGVLIRYHIKVGSASRVSFLVNFLAFSREDVVENGVEASIYQEAWKIYRLLLRIDGDRT